MGAHETFFDVENHDHDVAYGLWKSLIKKLDNLQDKIIKLDADLKQPGAGS